MVFIGSENGKSKIKQTDNAPNQVVSVFDLHLNQINRTEEDDTVTNLIDVTNPDPNTFGVADTDQFFEILFDLYGPEIAGDPLESLERFGEDRELTLQIGNLYYNATIDASNHIVFDDPTVLNKICYEDYLLIQLFQNDDMGNVLYEFAMTDFDPEPCFDTKTGSIIDCQNQQLSEVIGINGTSFTLFYKSNRVPDNIKSDPVEENPVSAWIHNFGAWTIDVPHAYDPARRKLYPGSGPRRPEENIDPERLGYTDDKIIVPSGDGSEIYLFDNTGRHMRTVSTFTGVTFYSFTYNSDGLLTGIEDAFGNLTTINRDGTGELTSIVSQDGQTTTLTLDSFGYLRIVTNPANEAVRLNYSTEGLLTSLIDPKMNTSFFTYDDEGKLTKDQNAAGGFYRLARTDGDTGFTVSVTSAEGRTDTYYMRQLADGYKQKINTDPAGLKTKSVFHQYKGSATTTPDGTVTTTEMSSDPRWGEQVPFTSSVTITTPGGLISNTTIDRAVTLKDSSDLMSIKTQTDTQTINGRAYTTTYDTDTKQIVSTTPEGRQTTTILNSKGQVIEGQIPGIEPVKYVYDTQGRITTII